VLVSAGSRTAATTCHDSLGVRVRRVIEVAGTQEYLHLCGDRASALTDCCPASRQARS
jgi:hypothetical protein